MRQDKQMDGQASRKEDNTMQRQSNFKEPGRTGRQNRQAGRASRQVVRRDRQANKTSSMVWASERGRQVVKGR